MYVNDTALSFLFFFYNMNVKMSGYKKHTLFYHHCLKAHAHSPTTVHATVHMHSLTMPMQQHWQLTFIICNNTCCNIVSDSQSHMQQCNMLLTSPQLQCTFTDTVCPDITIMSVWALFLPSFTDSVTCNDAHSFKLSWAMPRWEEHHNDPFQIQLRCKTQIN